MKVGLRVISCIVPLIAATFLGCQKEEKAGVASAGQPSGPQSPATVTQLPIAFLDGPDEGAVVRANSVATGWALDASGIAQVSATVDGQNPMVVSIGLPHPGVAAAYPGMPGNENAGFAIEIPSLQKGSHSLTIRIQAENGGKTEIRRQFLIE